MRGDPRLARAAIITIAALICVRPVRGDNPATQVPAATSAQVFRSEVRTVPVYATVRDTDGHLVTNLEQTSFRVLDDGKPVTVTYFSNDPQPLTAVLLLDVSSSMDDKINQVRASVRAFVDALEPGDRIRIGTFGGEIGLSPYLTDDKKILAHVIDEEVMAGGGTPLWAAIDAAETSIASEPGRREILVLTDGVDAPPKGLPSDRGALERRLDADEQVLLYAVGYAAGDYGFDLDSAAKKMAEHTGGGHYLVKSGDDLTATFHQIADELRHQYVFGFPPATDGRQHTIEVQVLDRRVSVKTRGGYIADKKDPVPAGKQP
jgi:VWFA-related protein